MITLCAIWYKEERERARETKYYVPYGTLKTIVTEEVEKAGLETNVTAYNPFLKRH